MRQFKLAAAVLASLVLVGCGGSDDNDDAPQFASLVSFGDSLSDVGTYKVGTVAQLGGGKYTINGADGKVWIELMAERLNLPAPCAAQTGLEGSAAQGFAVPVQQNNDCYAYGQGGSRVTNPVGPGNKALGGASAVLGQTTVPVATQIQNHLAKNGGSFSGDDVVFIMAGGNDVLTNLTAASATGDTAAAVTALGNAGAELATMIRDQVVGKGAKHVVVVNLPDVSVTPLGNSQSAQARSLISFLVTNFNSQLSTGLAGVDVVQVDAYTITRDIVANPAKYGASNVAIPACDLSPARNPLGNSLVCSRATLQAGVNPDTSVFADAIHLTPFGNRLLADQVTAAMTARGWL